MSHENQPPVRRANKDMSHEYLVECVQLLEDYTANMLQMILNHHPYMAPTANQIGEHFQARHAEIEARYPVSPILTPGLTIVKPH